MMIRKTIMIAMLLVAAITASAESILDGWEYTVRLGYNIGGTMPIGMPATIRSLNKYKLEANFALGIDVHKPLTSQWGVLSGLHLENKGMDVDATVKNYHMEMTQGGESIEGYYTGNLVTECDEWALTLTLFATFKVCDKVMLKCGPYLSYLATKSFKGYVYDGYLRKTDPTGEKTNMNNDKSVTFDFSDNMRRWQVGIDVGVDWQIGQRWGASADLQWGLNGIHKSSFTTIEQTLYPIYGTLGVIYKLK